MPTVAPFDLSGHCVAATFLDDIPVLAMADGVVHRYDHGQHTQETHDGLLCAARNRDFSALVTGGEDGRVVLLDARGGQKLIGEMPRKWIQAIATGPQGAIAYSSGREAVIRTADGTVKSLAEPRSIEGLAFAPKGLRIACARYNGVTMHWVATSGSPVELEWKGAHSLVTVSADGRFIVTAMQENALHGWKLDGKPGSETKHMRMTGYPAKIKSLSWSVKNRWLASSGAPAAIVWPFVGKDGPMGKAPLELGTRGDSQVTSVAFHPTQDFLAIGYQDGMILAARTADSKEIVLRRGGRGSITDMTWDQTGARLVFGSEHGDCGLVDISA